MVHVLGNGIEMLDMNYTQGLVRLFQSGVSRICKLQQNLFV